ncbi:MAG TPA: CpaF family protein, partial [Stellaceae bacterium]|nr:CpaF family protein [Stellaceae bacterium]
MSAESKNNAASAQELRNAENRKDPRKKVLWAASLETAQGGVECQIVDISPGGSKVRLDKVLGRDNPVTLIIGDIGEFHGVVAWEESGHAGIRFTAEDLSNGANRAASRRGRASDRRQEAPAQTASAPTSSASASSRVSNAVSRLRQPPIPKSEYAGPPAPAVKEAILRPSKPIAEGSVPAPKAPPTLQANAAAALDDRLKAAVTVIHAEINTLIDFRAAIDMPRAELERQLVEMVRDIARQKSVPLSGSEQSRVVQRIFDEMRGFGPLESLLADDNVTDILVNGAKQVYVERRGKLELSDVTFTDDDHVLHIATRIVTKVGRRIDETAPLADARLPDGSRVNVIVPPLALKGPMISIRKFAKKEITLDIMVKQRNLSQAMATVLQIASRSRLNILISGGTGSGKTTMLNAVSQMIDPSERILTIEDAAELQLQLPHVGSLETRPPNLEGRGEITMRDLFRNALRMRPDRIILGEIRSVEAFDMLQAMNTGHDGSLATIHASGPREALSRLESIIAVSGIDLPPRAVRSQIASALDLIVQVSRMRDGKRRITHITEVVGMEGDVVTMQDLFTYKFERETKAGELIGRFMSSGLRPHFMAKA